MTFFEAFGQTYKKGVISALITFPIFGPLFLYAVQPYWPKNIIGWRIILAIPFVLKVLILSFYVYVDERRKLEGQTKLSVKKIIKTIPLLILGVPIIVILFMKVAELIQGVFLKSAPNK